MSEIENGRLELHDPEQSKCNHLTALGLKGLTELLQLQRRKHVVHGSHKTTVTLQMYRMRQKPRLFWSVIDITNKPYTLDNYFMQCDGFECLISVLNNR